MVKEKKTFLLLIFLTFFCCAYELSYKSMIIILDDNEENVDLTLNSKKSDNCESPAGLGALSYTFLTACEQDTSSIIVSKNIFDSIFDHGQIFNDFSCENFNYLKKEYSKFTRFDTTEAIEEFQKLCVYAKNIFQETNKEIKELIKEKKTVNDLVSCLCENKKFFIENAPENFVKKYQEITAYLMCWRAILYMQNWVIKDVDNKFLLLIPKSSIKQIKNLTNIEKELGIKINHLKDYDLKNRKKGEKVHFAAYHNFVKYADKIFDTNNSSILWIIYLIGHGNPSENIQNQLQYIKKLEEFYTEDEQLKYLIEYQFQLEELLSYQALFDGTIAGMTLEHFSNFLNFLNDKINTHMLYYSSCYAGGQNLSKPYKIKNKNLVLNYPIIVSTLTNTQTPQELPMIYIPPYSKKKEGGKEIFCGITPQAINFETKNLALNSTINFKNFFNSAKNIDFNNIDQVYKLTSLIYIKDSKYNSISAIRYAGLDCFKPIITEDIEKREDLLLIKSTINNKSIKFKNELPQLINLCDSHSYIFKNIVANKFDLLQIIKNFNLLNTDQNARIFWIKRLTCKKNKNLTPLASLIYGKTMIIYDLFILQNCITSENLEKLPNICSDNIVCYFNLKVGSASHGFKIQYDNNKDFLVSKFDTSLIKDELSLYAEFFTEEQTTN